MNINPEGEENPIDKASEPLPVQPPKKKAKKKTSTGRFRWTADMTESLIDCLSEEKSEFEFKGLDFEADLVKLYGKIRIKMSKIYTNGEFGVTEPKVIEDGLETTQLAKEKIHLAEEKKTIKLGYDRIKTKAKEILQSYRKVVGEGRKSGSGKIVCDNWDKLKCIWGGSPGTICLENSISSFAMMATPTIMTNWDTVT